MTGYTHLLGGTAALWVLAVVPGGMENIGLSATVAMVGALTPDFDSPVSLLQTFSFRVRKDEYVRPFAILGVAVRGAFPHRGPMHSWLAMEALTVLTGIPLVAYGYWQAAAAFGLGYASHLLLDMCTVRGLMPMWPIRKPYWILPEGWRITTGSDGEWPVMMLLGTLALPLLIVRLFSYAA